MKSSNNLNSKIKRNWLFKKIQKYPVITLTIGFLLFAQLLVTYNTIVADKNFFLEMYGISIWFWIIILSIIYFLQWLLVVFIASKLPREKLKQKFFKHPIATIILFIIYISILPNNLAESGFSLGWFEIILYYAFVYLLWWLLFCWISNKIFKKQRFQWNWYQKVIEKIFIFLPIAYKIIFGIILAIVLFVIILSLFSVFFNYSGQDLKMLIN